MYDVVLDTASPERAYVRLRVAPDEAEASARALGLPRTPLTSALGATTALWIAPDQWLLASFTERADALLDRIGRTLADRLHHATDATDALGCFELSGCDARGVLAMGSGVDFDERTFATGHCVRTRFAKIAVVVYRVAADRFELVFDRTVADYLEQWLRRAITDAAA